MTKLPQPLDHATADIHDRVASTRAELKARAKTLQAAAVPLAPLGKPQAYGDFKRLDALLTKPRAKIDSFAPSPKLAVTTIDAVEPGSATARPSSARASTATSRPPATPPA